jgi:hypothetical protein
MINGDGQRHEQHGLPICVPRRAVSQMSTSDMGDLKGSETKGVMGDGHVNRAFQKMWVLQGDESTAV